MGNSCCVPLRSKFRNPDEIYVTNIDELAGWREADEIDSEELETWPTQVVTGSVVTKNQNRFSDSISEIDLASIGITPKFLSKRPSNSRRRLIEPSPVVNLVDESDSAAPDDVSLASTEDSLSSDMIGTNNEQHRSALENHHPETKSVSLNVDNN